MTSTEITTETRGKAATKPAPAPAPTPTPGFSYITANLQERAAYIARIAPSTIIPTAYRGNLANAFVAAETGAGLGLEPLQALSSIAVINGRATLSADLMAAIIRRAGHTLRIVENNPESVTAILIRADDKTFKFEVTWDKNKAMKACLWGQRGPWSQYPAQMLRARAITEVARQGASEVLMGMIYSPEDFNATITDTGEVIETPIANNTPAKPTAAPQNPAMQPTAAPQELPQTAKSITKSITRWQESILKGLDVLSFTQEDYDALCKRCLGQLISVTALADEQAQILHAELIAIYNSGRTQPTPQPAPEAEAEIINDQQPSIFGDDTDPNGGAV